jgi:hypothetical protein
MRMRRPIQPSKIIHLELCNCIIWLELHFERFVRWTMHFSPSSGNHFLYRRGILVSLTLDTVML